MRCDRIVILGMNCFFILFSFITRFVILRIIKESKNRTEENKKKEITKGKIISLFLLLIAISRV